MADREELYIHRRRHPRSPKNASLRLARPSVVLRGYFVGWGSNEN